MVNAIMRITTLCELLRIMRENARPIGIGPTVKTGTAAPVVVRLIGRIIGEDLMTSAHKLMNSYREEAARWRARAAENSALAPTYLHFNARAIANMAYWARIVAEEIKS